MNIQCDPLNSRPNNSWMTLIRDQVLDPIFWTLICEIWSDLMRNPRNFIKNPQNLIRTPQNLTNISKHTCSIQWKFTHHAWLQLTMCRRIICLYFQPNSSVNTWSNTMKIRTIMQEWLWTMVIIIHIISPIQGYLTHRTREAGIPALNYIVFLRSPGFKGLTCYQSVNTAHVSIK